MPIVPAEATDRASIVEVLTDAGLPHDGLSGEILSHFQVLRRNGAVQGVVGLEPAGQTALLRSLAVAPPVREHGYGTDLVRAAEAYAQRLDITALYLLTTTAAEFFSTLGYQRIDRTRVPDTIQRTEEFQHVCPDTATCMQKSLIS